MIALAYASHGFQAPVSLQANSIRGLATSWALFKWASIQEICAAASWSSPLTFSRFYELDVSAPSVAQVVLSTGPSLGQDALKWFTLIRFCFYLEPFAGGKKTSEFCFKLSEFMH